MQEPSDGDLLRRFQAGDTAAFEALVERYECALLRPARSILGDGRCHEDVVQDVFLRLVQSPPRVPRSAAGRAGLERAHLLSWLHRVTRNCCLDVVRSETRRRKREEAVAAAEPADGGLASVEAGDTREAVARGLQRLPSDQREVLTLRLLGEQSYREIAEITGKKIGTVGWLVSTGLKALSSELAPLLQGRGPGTAAGGPGATQVACLQGKLS